VPVKWLVLWLVAALALVACEKSQSAKDGMQALCDAQFTNATPAEYKVLMDKWVKDHVRNAEIRDLYAAADKAPTPVHRRALLVDAAKKYNIVDCGLTRETFNDKLAAVTGPGIEPLEDGGAVVVVTQTGIVIDGKSVASVQNGDVDPADKEGGALGVKISRVSAFVANLPNKDKRVLIAMDKTLPYKLLVEVIFSVKSAGIRDFGVVATKDGSEVMLPITLPDKARSAVAVVGDPDSDDGMVVAVGKPPPDGMPLQMIVTVTKKGELQLWSISGQEGTLRDPKLVLPAANAGPQLQAALSEIVARRFAAKRPERDRSLVFMADGAVPMQTVLETLSYVRRSPQRAELFPDVQLSSGFE
jgi:biopolymer transport protein ExbD